MELTRREFLKASGAGMGAFVVLKGIGPDSRPRAIPLRKEVLGETPTVCCYCSVGCGALVSADKASNLVVNLEGDPDNPINQGTLCSKGQSMSQVHNVNGEINPWRLTKPLYRAPGARDWTEISWSDAINKVANLVKETRDRTFTTTDNGKTVNRTEAIAHLGGGELDNEECYLLAKMSRALGMVYVEFCARL